jgi:hypothetical protein
MRRVRPLSSDDLMKGNPAVPGGPLKSKPTWLSTFGCLAASAFFRLRWRQMTATAGDERDAGNTRCRQRRLHMLTKAER